MVFEHKLPEHDGYYWVLDTEYPVPTIAFVQPNTRLFWINGKEWNFDHYWIHFAFGDKIEVPTQDTVEVKPFEWN